MVVDDSGADSMTRDRNPLSESAMSTAGVTGAAPDPEVVKHLSKRTAPNDQEKVPDTEQVKQAAKTRVAKVKEKIPSASQVKQHATSSVMKGKDKPVELALVSAAAGFVVGLITPVTRLEKEKVAPTAQQMKDKARASATKAASAMVAEQRIGNLTDQVKQKADESIETVAGQLREKADKVGLGEVADKVEEKARIGTEAIADTVRKSATAAAKKTLPSGSSSKSEQ